MLTPLGIRVNRQPAEADVAETLVVEEAITISRPCDEVYGFWRESENLPLAPDGDPEITRDAPGEELAWRAMRGEKLVHFGSLMFRDAPRGRGTIAPAPLDYVPAPGSRAAVTAPVTAPSP